MSENGSVFWNISRWFIVPIMTVFGAILGMWISMRVDVSRIDTTVKQHEIRLITLENNWRSIDYKLDLLLGKSASLADHARN
jgi:hypothetical protein